MKLIDPELKEEFENFLVNESRLSEKSVKNYSQAIYGSIANWIDRTYEVFEVSEIEKSVNEIKELPDFKKFNFQGNGMYNASLNYLGKFLNFKLPFGVLRQLTPIHSFAFSKSNLGIPFSTSSSYFLPVSFN